jgi:hypothetical protein
MRGWHFFRLDHVKKGYFIFIGKIQTKMAVIPPPSSEIVILICVI